MMHGPRPWRVAALALAVLIVIFGVVPTRAAVHAMAEGHDDLLTSGAHLVEFMVFAFVLAVALDGWHISGGTILRAGVLAVGLGIAIEIVQAPLPYRDAQLSDAVVDVAGTALGLAAVSGVALVRARRPRGRRG